MRDFDVLDDVLIGECLKTLHLNTTVVKSNDTWAWKTFWIQNKHQPDKQEYINFPILDSINPSSLVNRLVKYNKNHKNNVDKFYHITIMWIIDDYEMLDYILFSLILLWNVAHDCNVAFRDMNDLLYIEVANTFNDFLFNAIAIFTLLPDIENLVSFENFKDIKISKTFTDPLQMVTNYLYYFDKQELNDTDINPEVEVNVKTYTREECLQFLQKYFIKNNPDITFR